MLFWEVKNYNYRANITEIILPSGRLRAKTNSQLIMCYLIQSGDIPHVKLQLCYNMRTLSLCFPAWMHIHSCFKITILVV